MRAYVLTWSYDQEGCQVEGVFSTGAEVLAQARKLYPELQRYGVGTWLTVELWEDAERLGWVELTGDNAPDKIDKLAA